MSRMEPRVINIEPTPLIVAMSVEAVGLLEQIYYDNINEYTPDRREIPLTLRSKITVTNTDNNQTYIPTYTAEWRVFTPTASDGVLVNTTDITQDFYLTNNGKDLVVRKNVLYSVPYTVKCIITYRDDTTQSYESKVEKSVLLNTTMVSEASYPKLNIKAPNTSWFNPITMQGSSVYEFKAEARSENDDITDRLYYVWYARKGSSATYDPIDTIGTDGHCKFLCYEFADQHGKGQGTDTIYIDAMFAENITIMLTARRSQNGSFYPIRVYRNLIWKIPDMDIRTSCRNGDNKNKNKMLLENTIMLGAETLTDAQKDNLRFDWYSRSVDVAQVNRKSHGCVPNLPLEESDITNNNDANVNMFSEVYVLGECDKVTDNGENVTFNGELIIARVTNNEL